MEATINDTRFSDISGTEPSQYIIAAEYTIDTPPWVSSIGSYPMSATDGNFNNTIENVISDIDTTGLGPGRHTIFVRGKDANGNWGAVSAAFLYVIDPGTTPVLQGYAREAISGLPLAAAITANDTFQTSTNPATGFYQMYVISDTYDIEANAENYGSQIINNVAVYNGQVINQDFYLNPTCAVFSDDVESGNIGWTAQSPWEITAENSHSATHSWSDSPDGSYSNYRDISLTSPTINLGGFQ